MHDVCHLEFFKFAQYWSDLTTDTQFNRLLYPIGTYFDFDIDDFDNLLIRNGLHFNNDDLYELKNELIKNKCVSKIIANDICGTECKYQLVIILKELESP